MKQIAEALRQTSEALENVILGYGIGILDRKSVV